ncbi:MAG TPA: C-GCAxxG-C-C family protein [Spirochaetota bacterium]|nr:C-GCAxxG-C-C family protein [Spirochaetota bacterium]HQO23358.1 C-GCAxxG-C-C family protein [Spirochaetota bacterium]HQQ23998.1 C-GCAxxG-C-C family protein [Spirochaetota bacterium]
MQTTDLTETKKETYIKKALDYFDSGYACSQSVLLAFSSEYGLDEEIAKKISSTFGGGMGRLRQKCGALTGAFMVLGLEFGNTEPLDMETKLSAYAKVRELDKKADEIYGTTQCAEILKKYVKSTDDVKKRKHHQIICRKVVGDAVDLVFEFIKNNKE